MRALSACPDRRTIPAPTTRIRLSPRLGRDLARAFNVARKIDSGSAVNAPPSRRGADAVRRGQGSGMALRWRAGVNEFTELRWITLHTTPSITRSDRCCGDLTRILKRR